MNETFSKPEPRPLVLLHLISAAFRQITQLMKHQKLVGVQVKVPVWREASAFV